MTRPPRGPLTTRGCEMTIKELFEHERYLASISSAYLPEGVFQLLDRIEAAVTERIEELEELVESYERVIIST